MIEAKAIVRFELFEWVCVVVKTDISITSMPPREQSHAIPLKLERIALTESLVSSFDFDQLWLLPVLKIYLDSLVVSLRARMTSSREIMPSN
jgi:hypothetical protein